MFSPKLMVFLPLAALAFPACAQQAGSRQAEPQQGQQPFHQHYSTSSRGKWGRLRRGRERSA